MATDTGHDDLTVDTIGQSSATATFKEWIPQAAIDNSAKHAGTSWMPAFPADRRSIARRSKNFQCGDRAYGPSGLAASRLMRMAVGREGLQLPARAYAPLEVNGAKSALPPYFPVDVEGPSGRQAIAGGRKNALTSITGLSGQFDFCVVQLPADASRSHRLDRTSILIPSMAKTETKLICTDATALPKSVANDRLQSACGETFERLNGRSHRRDHGVRPALLHSRNASGNCSTKVRAKPHLDVFCLCCSLYALTAENSFVLLELGQLLRLNCTLYQPLLAQCILTNRGEGCLVQPDIKSTIFLFKNASSARVAQAPRNEISSWDRYSFCSGPCARHFREN